MTEIKNILKKIYSFEDANYIFERIEPVINDFKNNSKSLKKEKWSEKDVVLITYGDSIYENNVKTLNTLNKFYLKYLQSTINYIHILPFYPYTSDDGFSVVDYRKINSDLGDWDDIEVLAKEVNLMFDFVCNHISAKSEWFLEYLKGNEKYKDYFIEMDPNTDLSKVVRPRALPLLTKFNDKYIWTTFSEDQIDLNYKSKDLIIEILKILIFYVSKKSSWIRLDAIGFMWKDLETNCIHHEFAHQLIKLFRAVVDELKQNTVLITETNVPHEFNISYFGNGLDEAHMVYQFPLPPLVLYSVRNQNTEYLKKWFESLDFSNQNTTFFNFLSSHDGIGLNPIRGIIEEEKILKLVDDLKENKALVNFKQNEDGSLSPYEINVVYLDALANLNESNELRIKKQILAHNILLTLPGVPAIYIHSLIGSRNYYKGVEKTKQNRTINREKLEYDVLVSDLENDEVRFNVFNLLKTLIDLRIKEEAFHPNNEAILHKTDNDLFVLERIGASSILIISNFTEVLKTYVVSENYFDLIDSQKIIKNEKIDIEPFSFKWLKKEKR